MRFRAEAIGLALAATLLTAAPSAQPPPEAQPSAVATVVTNEEVTDALAKVRRDPNLGGERTIKMMRWRQAGQPAKMNLSWLSWVAGFFGWLMQSARYLVWVGLVVLVAFLGVYIWRAVQARQSGQDEADAFVPPTHVRDLDIRPESLPPNIGRAARQLWERGEHRGALSLLYRGLLSRLTHVHRVPIVDSSTEGDCLLLLAERVPPGTGAYAATVVEAWRAYVYGGTAIPTPDLFELCDGFAAAMDRAVDRPRERGAA
jgi:hypothetical protein